MPPPTPVTPAPVESPPLEVVPLVDAGADDATARKKTMTSTPKEKAMPLDAETKSAVTFLKGSRAPAG